MNTKSFEHSRLYDLLCASPLIVAYGFALAGTIQLLEKQSGTLQGAQTWLVAASETSTFIYLAVQIGLFLFRSLPLAKSEGVLPRLAAVLGANANFALLLLPKLSLPWAMTAFSMTITLLGTAGAVLTLGFLGRGFSILPEARQFVSTGPYRFVRHPLYLTEIVATLGIAMNYRQPWSLLVSMVSIALQVRRMQHEETVMARTFPDYAAYAARTARLLPGLY